MLSRTGDAIELLDFLFQIPGHRVPYCQKAADVNDDGLLDIADPIFLTYMIAGVNPLFYVPPEPFNEPLIDDPTPDDLTCDLDGYDCENR